ncbi:homeodomain-like protein [Tanacetum coccineum]|uniref:Homeodomain-like protein n=1 Tax=Tanacetum coccineum TaxID=301880 RepID=A0ABQ5HET4_9ASTR
MVIEMADRSMQSPKGIVENVLVKINKFIFLVDFIILDIIEDDKVPIILGRPMLATAHARIDVFARLNDDSSEMFSNPNSSSSISVDDFVDMDDVWDNLDYRDLTNEATKFPVKPEFLSSSNRIHLHGPYNLQITCKIGFVNFDPYIEPQSPFNIMSRKAYNSIMKHELVYTGNNMVGFATNLHVFVGGHQFLIDFIILENINEFVEKGLTEVLFGQPFKEHVGIVDDRVNRVLWFKIKDDKTIFNMPRAGKKIGKLTVRQHNTMGPILKISDEDKSRGIHHPYQKIKGFYQGCLELGEEYKHDQEAIDWVKGHAT